MVYHQRKTLKQRYTQGTIRTLEESDDDWRNLACILILGELLADSHHKRDHPWTTATKFGRFEQFRQHLDLEKLFREVIRLGDTIELSKGSSQCGSRESCVDFLRDELLSLALCL